MIWSDEVRQAARHLASVPPERMSPRALVALRALQRAGAHAAETLAVRLSRWQTNGSGLAGGPARTLRQLLVMPVGDRCNLACQYCYEATRRGDGAGSMSGETLRRVLINVLPYVQRPFAIGWHGGEPLLRGRRFYRDAFRLVREVAGGDWVQHIVQSNATLLDREWVDLFRENGAAVGISLDGPPPLNDAVRIRPDGSGSYEAVTRGIAALRAGGVPFSTIVVISAGHAARPGQARELLDHFREIGITLYDVHPAYSHTPRGADHNLHPEAFARFTTELFDRWLDTGDTAIRINFFEHVLQGMSGQRSVACYLSGGCATILGVGPDGATIPCTRPFDASYTFGSLAEQTLPEILGGDAFRRFAARELGGRTQKAGCEWAAVCGAGCPHERVSNGTQAVEGTNVYCTCGQDGRGGYPAIFRHMQTGIETVLTEAAAGAGKRRGGGASVSAVDCGAFARAGYVLLPGLVPASRASRLAGHYLAVRKSAAADGDAGNMDRYDRLLQVHLRDPESRWLAHHAPLVDAVATLLDDDPLLAKTIVYFKPPGARGVALHQDERFFPLTPLVSAVVALDPCDQGNGGLRVVPGSHIGGLLPVEEDDPSRSILTHRTALGDRVGDVGIDMQPGDVLLMHGALVHGSAPNQSLDRFRRSVLCIFTGHKTAGFSDLLVQLAERAAASRQSQAGSFRTGRVKGKSCCAH